MDLLCSEEDGIKYSINRDDVIKRTGVSAKNDDDDDDLLGTMRHNEQEDLPQVYHMISSSSPPLSQSQRHESNKLTANTYDGMGGHRAGGDAAGGGDSSGLGDGGMLGCSTSKRKEQSEDAIAAGTDFSGIMLDRKNAEYRAASEPQQLRAQNLSRSNTNLQAMAESTPQLIKRDHSFKRNKTKTPVCLFPMEKHCKIVFGKQNIPTPTNFVILPYELEKEGGVEGGVNCHEGLKTRSSWNPGCAASDEGLKIRLVASTREGAAQAVHLGQCLLDINKCTAELSFWLAMKRYLESSSLRRSRLKEWMINCKTESIDLVAMDIVTTVRCGSEYLDLAKEMLQRGIDDDRNKAFRKNPIGFAKKEIRANVVTLLECYPKDGTQFFYLVDEFLGSPVHSSSNSTSQDPSGKFGSHVIGMYPLRVYASREVLKESFLPFLNLSAMTAIAVNGLEGLAGLLGLRTDRGIPKGWMATKAGLIHRIDRPSSVTELAVLQGVLKRKARRRSSLTCSTGLLHGRMGKKLSSSVSYIESSEFDELERLYRYEDPLNKFSGLSRVAVGKCFGLWSKKEVANELQQSTSLLSAEIESRIRELRKRWVQREMKTREMECVAERLQELKKQNGPLSSVTVHEVPARKPKKKDFSLSSVTIHGLPSRKPKRAEDALSSSTLHGFLPRVPRVNVGAGDEQFTEKLNCGMGESNGISLSMLMMMEDCSYGSSPKEMPMSQSFASGGTAAFPGSGDADIGAMRSSVITADDESAVVMSLDAMTAPMPTHKKTTASCG